MSIEGRSHTDLDVGTGLDDAVDDSGEVALQVDAEGEEVGYDGDAVDAGGDEGLGGFLESGMGHLEEGDVVARHAGLMGGFRDDDADCLVSGFHAGAVGEEDDGWVHEMMSEEG